jgi:polyhydroxyalkanoate synthesis regulator phasin
MALVASEGALEDGGTTWETMGGLFMRRASTVVVLVVLMVFVGSTFAFAADFYTDFHARIARQQSRIDNGIKKGELTQGEAQIVQDNLNYIKAESTRLKGDGRLTPKEQKRLMKMLDDNGRMIKDKRKNYRKLY